MDLKSLSATKGSKVQEPEGQKGQVPEDLKNADQSFKNLSLRLINESKGLPHDLFQKLAYSIEMEVLESNLLSVEKEFILKQLAVLKIYSDIKHQKLNIENWRIACDSQFECDLLACVAAKVEDALNEDNSWVEIVYNTIIMPEEFPRWWIFCTLELLAP